MFPIYYSLMAVRKCSWTSDVGKIHTVWASADIKAYTNLTLIMQYLFCVAFANTLIYGHMYPWWCQWERGKKNSSEKSSTDCYTFMHSRTCVTLSMVLLCMYGMSTYWTNLCAWAYVYVGTAMLQWPIRLPTWAATRFLTEWLHATSVPLVVPARGA